MTVKDVMEYSDNITVDTDIFDVFSILIILVVVSMVLLVNIKKKK